MTTATPAPPALTEERLWELKAEARECLHRLARAELDSAVSRDAAWFSRELHAAWEENARLRLELARLQDVAGSEGADVQRCTSCGLDLTPTPEQREALMRFGNPLRRPPCLKTKSGMHTVDVDRPASAARGEGENQC